MPLTVGVKTKGERVFVLIPKGRIDSETNDIFDKKIKNVLGNNPASLVIDMSDVYYISSVGLNSILHAYKEMIKNKGKILLTNLQPQIRKVFDVIKALPSHSIFANMSEVDEYLDAIQTGEVANPEDGNL